MARLFILFLIVLLPLRGWTAERMAMEGGAPLAVSQSVDTGMSEECALHMHTAQSGHDHGGQAQAPVHKGCQSCQLCMPLAGLHSPVVLALAAIPQTLPLMRSSRFVSADPAHDVKPPIS